MDGGPFVNRGRAEMTLIFSSFHDLPVVYEARLAASPELGFGAFARR
jgi:hypothetical protein